MAVRASERVTLIVGGNKFEDWTSIVVQRTWGAPYDEFRFTCAEREGATASQVNSSSRFKPGDKCRIELAGQLAMEGEIITRQCAYDGHSHGVELQGTNQTWPAATSSVIHKTNSFDGKTFAEIVAEVLGPTGVAWDFNPDPPPQKLKYVHSEKGETNFAFLERIARNLKIIITCTKVGGFLFICEGRQTGNQGRLIEGKNIKKMQCVVSVQNSYSKIFVVGQSNASNELNYVKASQQKAEVAGKYKGYRPLVIPQEQPTTEQTLVKTNAENAAMWQAGTEINATVVVYGWQINEGGPLWEPGSDVTVHSPMAMLNNQKMTLQSVTHTQDNNSGTQTTLLCVSENVLNGPPENFAVAAG